MLRTKWVSPRLLLGAIVLTTIALRIAYIAFFGHTLSLQTSGYDAYAVNILDGKGYTRFADFHQDSDLPPLYSFFLVGVYKILGRGPIQVAVIQIAFDVVTVLSIYAIGRRVGGEGVGLLAAAFTGFYPYLLFQDVTVNDTAIFIMLLSVGIWMIYRAHAAQRWGWAAGAGAVFGLAALTKTLVILLLPMIGLWWLITWWRSSRLKAFIPIAALGIAFVAVLAPWIVRNTRLHGAFTLVSTNDGSNLLQGNNPCVADYLLAGWDAQWVTCLPEKPTGLTELQEAAWFRDQAISYLRNNVGQWPRLLLVKFMNLWSPDLMPRSVPPTANLDNTAVLQYEGSAFKLARILHLLFFTPLLVLGVVGVWRGARDRRIILPLIMVLVSITIAYLIYHPYTRYRSPADPFLFVLAAYTSVWLWARLVEPRLNVR